MLYDNLLEFALGRADADDNEINVIKRDGETIEYLFDNCEITFPEGYRFFGRVNCERIMHKVGEKRRLKLSADKNFEKYKAGENTLTYTGDYDFGHTSPVWDDILKLGFVGLRDRVIEYKNKNGDENGFYGATVKVYDSLLRFISRCADEAKKLGKTEIANGLYNLSEKAPSNLFEAIQTVFVYYCAQQYMECTILRTLGRLDSLLMPFYNGSDEEKQMICDFMSEAQALKVRANLPFALGGVDKSGKTLVNEMSYLLLEAYQNLKPVDVKIHILYSKDMPVDFVDKVLDGIRNGANNLVFLCDDIIQAGLIKLGEDKDDARQYSVVGCYECGGREEVTCSCNAYVNIAKAVELAMNGGYDVLSGEKVGLDTETEICDFNDFYKEVVRQLKYILECAMEKTDICERKYPEVHFAPLLSSTYKSSLENGGDIYCHHSAKYTNSSVNALGLATLVDSIVSVKKLVFEDRKISLKEFSEILKNNWLGNEPLRLMVKNKFPKYGNGIAEIDKIAADIVQTLSDTVNGRANVKGGVYRLGTFSIDWRIDYGAKMAASADGRLSGQPTSQNAGASFGADREGVTAHILSVTEIDAVNVVNGNILDLDMHSSAVIGDDGLSAMRATLKTYFERGGFGIHYNVLDRNILIDAQANPEKYPNLQVRLCGWNVLFSDLSREEQEEFINRANYKAV